MTKETRKRKKAVKALEKAVKKAVKRESLGGWWKMQSGRQ
jgi:hypothetical protein